MGRLSIKGQLQKARTKGKVVSILLEWSNSYQGQFHGLIRKMDKAKRKVISARWAFTLANLTDYKKSFSQAF